MRALIVAANISARMGGEAILPWHYVRELSALGVEVHALTHARVREEISDGPLADAAAFHYVEDAALERFLHQLGEITPGALRETVFNTAISAVTLARMGRKARALERETSFDVIHQPTPVSPQLPSFLTGMRAPVVIGPLNGGMDYPPAFEKDYARGSSAAVAVARSVSSLANNLISGKRQASRLLAANERTLAALPEGVDRSRAAILVENGVDLDLWSPPDAPRPATPVFVFVGRLVWWKALDLLIDAFAALNAPARLVIIGDGPERAALEAQAKTKTHPDRPIEFLGFRPQTEIRDALAAATALILPSMRECGGAVVLEAFACQTPAIATDWGGPQDYVTPETGILIPPNGRADFISTLKDAMAALAGDPARVRSMGVAARARVEALYSWRAKAAAMLDIYKEIASQKASSQE